jgi:hypothetical protein
MTLPQNVKVRHLYDYAEYEQLLLDSFPFHGNHSIRFFNPEFPKNAYIFLDFPIDVSKFKKIYTERSVPEFGSSTRRFFFRNKASF